MIEDEFEQKKNCARGVLSLAELNRIELSVKQYHKTIRDFELTGLKIDTLQTQQELLEDDLERTVMRPPFDGYISEVFVEQG